MAKRELDAARAAHGHIQLRHDHLVQELEATHSELNLSYTYLVKLDTQLSMLEAEDERLTGLLHPVRRCPDDVLRLIFESAIDSSESYSFKIATVLSHVCKDWRVVALGMKYLWRYVQISLRADLEDARLCMERTKARVRDLPISLTIVGIQKALLDNTNLMPSIKIDEFTRLSTLRLVVVSSAEIPALCHPNLSFPPITVDKLILRSQFPSQIQRIWDCAPMLDQFSAVMELKLDNLGTINLSGTNNFSSITRIYIIRVSMPSLPSHLMRFPQLQELDISGQKFDMDPHHQDINLPKLENLTIRKVGNFPWRRILAPKLQRVKLSDNSEGATAFLCRHPSVEHLLYTVKTTEGQFKAIAKTLGNLKSLEIRGDINGLFMEIDPDVPFPPFPKLESIELNDEASNPLSLEDFESFLSSRRLLQQETGPSGLQRIKMLKVFLETNRLESTLWRKSALLVQVQETIETLQGGHSRVMLKMPD